MEITKNIHQLKHHFKIKLNNGTEVERFANSLIVFDKDLTLIDTGTKYSFNTIKKYLEFYGRNIEDVKNIILTHAHPDHIGSVYKIKEISKCKIFAHIREKEWIEDIDLQFKNRPVPGFYELVDKPVEIDELLNGNEIINVGSTDIEILNSPGHSPGSINLLFKNENIIFTADSIPLKNDIPNYDNYNDLVQSLQTIIKHAPYNAVLSSWNSPFYSLDDQLHILKEGMCYLERIDNLVKKIYDKNNIDNIDYCKKVISFLKLPDFMANPIVHKAFKSHL